MTSTSRRALLWATGSGVLLAPLIAHPAAATTSSYSRSRFAPLLERRFSVRGGGQRWVMTLVNIDDLSHSTPGDDRCFALTLRASSSGPGQGTVTLRRRDFAATPLFIVPSDEARLTYQAVVNGVG